MKVIRSSSRSQQHRWDIYRGNKIHTFLVGPSLIKRQSCYYPHMPIDMLGIYCLLYHSLSVCLHVHNFCNGYLRRGLMQGGEIYQDDRSGSVAGHLLFW